MGRAGRMNETGPHLKRLYEEFERVHGGAAGRTVNVSYECRRSVSGGASGGYSVAGRDVPACACVRFPNVGVLLDYQTFRDLMVADLPHGYLRRFSLSDPSPSRLAGG